MTTVTLDKAGHDLAELVRRAQAGEEIIIVDADQPLAKLVGVGEPASDEPRKPGALKGRLNLPDSFIFDPLPDKELKLWWGDTPATK